MKINVPFFFIALFFIIISPDQLSMAYAALALYIVVRLFWREGEPKILFVNMLIYWLTVSILMPYGALFGIPLSSLSDRATETIKQAHLLSVTAMLFYAFGIHIIVRKVKLVNRENLYSILERYDGLKLFWAYIGYSVLTRFFGAVFASFAGGQLLIGFIFFKWAFLAFLIIHTLVVPSNKKYVITLIIIELLLSFSGFWASYKDYILVATAAFFTFTSRVNFRAVITTSLIFALTYFVSVVWSFSKGEYRRYLTGGERSQYIVKTDQVENLQTLWSIVSKDFSEENFWTSFNKGSEGLLFRVSYIEYFARSLKHVPTFVPHEDGKLLLGAFEHIFKPRIFFPDKSIIDDSEITSKYTGTQFAGRNEGTSFAFGIVPERYVDFGPIYMFIPIFFFGLWIGFMYKFFIVNGYNLVWGLCYSAPMFNFMVAFGLATTKFFGWSVTYFVILFMINKYLIKYLDRWLLRKDAMVN